MVKYFLAFLIIFLIACENQDDEITNPYINRNENTEEVLLFLQDANGFRITTFVEDDSDKTNDFNGYLFTFESNGLVSAKKEQNIINGTYRVFRDDGLIELSMTFSNINAFYELTDDWYFSNIQDNTIRFADDNDVLQFTKNN